jgi:hypothetical protein
MPERGKKLVFYLAGFICWVMFAATMFGIIIDGIAVRTILDRTPLALVSLAGAIWCRLLLRRSG